MSKQDSKNGARSLRPVIGATLLFLLGLLALGGIKSYRDLAQARDRVQELESQSQAAETRIEGLKQEIEQLQGDSHTLERRARDDLGMAKPGDLVIVLPEDEEEESEKEPSSDAEGSSAQQTPG